MPRRVLILSASSGAGDVRAAQGAGAAFAARGDCAVQHIDALDYVSKLFQEIHEDAYIAMVRRAPSLMGLLYNRTNRPWWHLRRRLVFDPLNTRPMIGLLQRVQPELCVATHFLPAQIIAWLKAKRKIRARHAIVVTDFDVHAMMRRKHGLSPERTTVLVFGRRLWGWANGTVGDGLARTRPAVADCSGRGQAEKVRARLLLRPAVRLRRNTDCFGHAPPHPTDRCRRYPLGKQRLF